MGTLAIVGAGGVLGTKLVEQALALNDSLHERVVAFAHRLPPPERRIGGERVTWEALDIGDAAAVANTLARVCPAAVINTAAMTNVDACEDRPDEALAANGAGPGHLAAACVRLGAPLVHVSTDYVFPGDDAEPGPYVDGATVRPVNHYGRTKLEGERAVEAACAGRVTWLVARTALVYGHIPGGRANFASWLASELRAGRRVRVVDDQWNTPTLADDLAAALLRLLARGTQGIIHVAGPDLLARDEWARQIAAYYGLDAGLINVTSTAALAQRARRPLRSGLRTTRAAELGGVALSGVRAGLAALDLP